MTNDILTPEECAELQESYQDDGISLGLSDDLLRRALATIAWYKDYIKQIENDNQALAQDQDMTTYKKQNERIAILEAENERLQNAHPLDRLTNMLSDDEKQLERIAILEAENERLRMESRHRLWEYKRLKASAWTMDDYELDDLGAEGWEVVGVAVNPGGDDIILFKREARKAVGDLS